MRKPTIQSLRHGQTVYHVLVTPNGASVSKYVVLCRPKYMQLSRGYGAWYVRARFYSDIMWDYRETDIYLGDCNVPTNDYSDHRLFYSRRKAYTYASEVNSGRLPMDKSSLEKMREMWKQPLPPLMSVSA